MSDDPLTAALAGDDAAWARQRLERDIVAWLTTVSPDRRVQSSIISFLRDGPDLSIEGVAQADPTIPRMDVHDRYRAKYEQPHAHWGLDFTNTAREFSLPIRIRPTRVRLA